MQKHYESFYKNARDLEHKIQDLLDKPDHQSARKLRDEALKLIDELEQDKSPRNIESRIEAIQRVLMDSQHKGEGIMNVEHSMFFKDRYEDMRREIRKLPNY